MKVKSFEVERDKDSFTTDASIKVNGKYVAHIHASSFRTNKQTDEIIKGIEEFLKREQGEPDGPNLMKLPLKRMLKDAESAKEKENACGN